MLEEMNSMTTRTTTACVHPLWIALFGLAVLPLLEFAAFFAVASRIGFLPALAALILTSVIGASLLRRQGGEAVARLVAALRRGEPPHGAARESFMVALGGVLMILPGFVSDAVGFALILPSLMRSLSEGTAVSRRPPAPSAKGKRIINLDSAQWRSLD
jgi:UPF0716 protein FxsA